MSGYRATRDYQAVYRSKAIGFSKGDAVDVDPEVAEWVNRDSPGCLKATGKQTDEEPETETVEEPAAEKAAEPAPKPVKRAAKKRAPKKRS